MPPRITKPRRFRPKRRKPCQFCIDKVELIDYKGHHKLRKFVNDRGKIMPRKNSGACAKHQRVLTVAIKRARFMALLPFVAD